MWTYQWFADYESSFDNSCYTFLRIFCDLNYWAIVSLSPNVSLALFRFIVLLHCLKMVFKKNYDCLPNRDLNTRTLKLSQYFYQSSNCVFLFQIQYDSTESKQWKWSKVWRIHCSKTVNLIQKRQTWLTLTSMNRFWWKCSLSCMSCFSSLPH